jgi:hypothetical protein
MKKEISWHLKNIGYWPVQMNGNKFATGRIMKKPVEVVKGRILAGGAQKSPEPCSLSLHPEETSNATQEYRHLLGTPDLAKPKINDTGAWN